MGFLAGSTGGLSMDVDNGLSAGGALVVRAASLSFLLPVLLVGFWFAVQGADDGRFFTDVDGTGCSMTGFANSVVSEMSSVDDCGGAGEVLTSLLDCLL